jgi:hypothetical protein
MRLLKQSMLEGNDYMTLVECTVAAPKELNMQEQRLANIKEQKLVNMKEQKLVNMKEPRLVNM